MGRINHSYCLSFNNDIELQVHSKAGKLELALDNVLDIRQVRHTCPMRDLNAIRIVRIDEVLSDIDQTSSVSSISGF